MRVCVEDVAETIKRTNGFDVSVYEPSFLVKCIEKRCVGLDLLTFDQYIRVLENDASEADSLIGAMNIPYTDFFRGTLSFALLEQWVLPMMMKKKGEGQEIRIWSTGCSTGQEAYSLAMLLEGVFSSVVESTDTNLFSMSAKNTEDFSTAGYRIFATDQSESALSKAVEGRYGVEAVQNLKLKYLNKFFLCRGDQYEIVPSLKKWINFSLHSLLDPVMATPPESIYGGFDLVVCSNLLFYYRQEVREIFLGKIKRAIRTDGFLMTGETERSIVGNFPGFIAISPSTAIFRKTGN